MPPDLLAELAQIDGIEAVKQANSDELQPIDGLAILAGNDDILAKVLDMGEAGGICVSSHIVGRRDEAPLHRTRAAAPRSTPSFRTSTRRCSSPPAQRRSRAALETARPRRRRAAPAARRVRRGRDRDRPRLPEPPRACSSRGTHRVSGKLRVLPLGGLGEIGKNMTVVEYDDRIVVGRLRSALPDGRDDGHRPRPARLHLPARARRRHRGDRHHARPRGPPRRPAVGAARPRRPGQPRRLRRPADDRDGPLQARRAQAQGRRARGPACRTGGGRRPVRARARPHDALDPRLPAASR